jgi:hypothetical protein
MSGIKSEHPKWWILAAMGFSLAVVVLDETIERDSRLSKYIFDGCWDFPYCFCACF